MGAAGAGGGRQLWPVVLFFSGSCRRPRPALTPSLFPLEDRRLLRPVHLKRQASTRKAQQTRRPARLCRHAPVPLPADPSRRSSPMVLSPPPALSPTPLQWPNPSVGMTPPSPPPSQSRWSQRSTFSRAVARTTRPTSAAWVRARCVARELDLGVRRVPAHATGLSGGGGGSRHSCVEWSASFEHNGQRRVAYDAAAAVCGRSVNRVGESVARGSVLEWQLTEGWLLRVAEVADTGW